MWWITTEEASMTKQRREPTSPGDILQEEFRGRRA